MSTESGGDSPPKAVRRKDSTGWLLNLKRRFKSEGDNVPGDSDQQPPSSFRPGNLAAKRKGLLRRRTLSLSTSEIFPDSSANGSLPRDARPRYNGNGVRGKTISSFATDKDVPPLPVESEVNGTKDKPIPPLPVDEAQGETGPKFPEPTSRSSTTNGFHREEGKGKDYVSFPVPLSIPTPNASEVEIPRADSPEELNPPGGEAVDPVTSLVNDGIVEKIDAKVSSAKPESQFVTVSRTINDEINDPISPGRSVFVTFTHPLKAIWDITADEAGSLIQSLGEDIPLLMNVLDEVAQLHPVVAGPCVSYECIMVDYG